MKLSQRNLIDRIRAYAFERYAMEGWDILVECWSDEDILEAMEGATSLREALARVGRAVRELHDYRTEVKATEF